MNTTVKVQVKVHSVYEPSDSNVSMSTNMPTYSIHQSSSFVSSTCYRSGM